MTGTSRYITIVLIILFCGLVIASDAVSGSMKLSKTSFDQLPGWSMDNQAEALLAFRKSCQEIVKRDVDSNKAPLQQHASTQAWQRACQAAMRVSRITTQDARTFFETWFDPFLVRDQAESTGLFTGYYMPLIHGSLKRDKRYKVPVHALPDDWVKIDLGAHYDGMEGRSLVGQVKDHSLHPYPDRRAITLGALKDKARVIVWADNPVDVYFAQVQGSSLVELPDGRRFIIGYAGDNGHRYTSIGKVLIDDQQISRDEVSMQSIRDWINRNPLKAEALMNQNASYVFFKLLDQEHPLGTERVALTPRRSLAVDQRFIPLGAPVWLSTDIPDGQRNQGGKRLRRLMVAQDTGGAIKGIVRGDVYWGSGEQAAYIAGHMKSQGQYWLLLPRAKI